MAMANCESVEFFSHPCNDLRLASNPPILDSFTHSAHIRWIGNVTSGLYGLSIQHQKGIALVAVAYYQRWRIRLIARSRMNWWRLVWNVLRISLTV